MSFSSWCKVYKAYMNYFGKCFYYFYYVKELVQDWCYFLLYAKYLTSGARTWNSFVRVFFNTTCIACLWDTGQLRLLKFSWFVMLGFLGTFSSGHIFLTFFKIMNGCWILLIVFLHGLIWSWDLFSLACLYGRLHQLIFSYWTSLINTEIKPFHHGV